MLLQEPPRSPYDLNFQVFGFPIRVFWGFWVAAVVLGWDWSSGLDRLASRVEIDSPGAPALLLIWVSVVLVSILIHELGHCLAFRYYGMDSQIVLYHFGGLAIPSSFGSWNAARQRHLGPIEHMVISAAGPGLQIVFALLAIVIGVVMNVPMDVLWFHYSGAPLNSIALYACLDAWLFVSLFWALINLVPILPLDGGQIMRNALIHFNVSRPDYNAHLVSVVTGGLIGLYFLSSGNPIAGIMFLIFAASNWQSMQYGGYY